MSSVSSQPQFRYTQPPSKVLHLRNLPWECTEEELIELGKPFGRVVNTKCNVGANRNQAFIEFVGVNCPFLNTESFICSLIWMSFFVFEMLCRQNWIKLLQWYHTMRHLRSQHRFEGKLSIYSIPTDKKSWTTKRLQTLLGMYYWWQLKGMMRVLLALMCYIW